MPSPSRKNPWSSPEWQEMRDRVLKDFCEICGSRTPPFSPHHTKPLPSYNETRLLVANKLFHELSSNDSLNTDLIEVTIRDSCPKCDSINVQGPRATITPPFYCGRCGSRFDKPSKTEKKNFKPLRRDFFKHYKDEIGRLTEEERKKQTEYYLSGDDVITVCKRCHRPVEQGKVLCKLCKKHFHPPHFAQCWNCHEQKMISGDKIKCKFCDTRFHSSDELACKECSSVRDYAYCPICKQDKFSLRCFCDDCQISLCEDCASIHDDKGHDTICHDVM